jgi:hypothetical protein
MEGHIEPHGDDACGLIWKQNRFLTPQNTALLHHLQAPRHVIGNCLLFSNIFELHPPGLPSVRAKRSFATSLNYTRRGSRQKHAGGRSVQINLPSVHSSAQRRACTAKGRFEHPFSVLLLTSKKILFKKTKQKNVCHVLSLYRFCLWLSKSRVGNIMAKASALRVNLNLDGAPIASSSHTHPSYSQTSHLLTLSVFRCSSSKTNPVYPRRVNSLLLVCSRSSHRHSYIPLIFGSRFIDS